MRWRLSTCSVSRSNRRKLDRAGYGEADVARMKQRLGHYLDVREIIRNASGETLDLKPYEADMRHLIDTYIEADEPRKISPFDNLGLLDLIVKTGIASAIASRLGGLKGNRDAIAETIENNVRSKIIKEHLSDPAFYEKMSALLDEIIALRKAKAIEYEEYLKRVAEVARKVQAGQADDTPEPLKNSPALRALYNHLMKRHLMQAGGASVASGVPALELALTIDAAVKQVRPDEWRGTKARERVIQEALFEILHDEAEVERIFAIVLAQSEY
jgi:type I restriction enzyme R subunit